MRIKEKVFASTFSAYNAQPGVLINYATGANDLDESYDANVIDPIVDDIEEPLVVDSEISDNRKEQSQTYILNKNTKKNSLSVVFLSR